MGSDHALLILNAGHIYVYVNWSFYFICTCTMCVKFYATRVHSGFACGSMID